MSLHFFWQAKFSLSYLHADNRRRDEDQWSDFAALYLYLYEIYIYIYAIQYRYICISIHAAQYIRG